MACNGFTNIVTSGLVLSLDAGNTKSYPGSGTSWLDLSSNSLNGTLSNCTFNSANVGSIAFNGSTSYVGLGDNDLFSFTSGGGVDLPFSICMWVKLGAYGTGVYKYSSLIMKSQYLSGTWAGNREWQFSHSNDTSPNASGIALSMFNSDAQAFLNRSTNSILPLNTWYFLTSTYNGSKLASGIKLYINGLLQTSFDNSSGSYGGMINTGTTVEMGRQFMPIGGSFDLGQLNGNISNVLIYRNKELTASEVLQNYNATKTRFI